MGQKGGTAATRVGPWPPETFEFWGRKTYPLEELREGSYTKADFEAQVKSENKMIAYILRLVFFIVMICAFGCIFQPLSVAADLLRVLNYCTCCLGSILDHAAQSVISCVSCMSACWCFTVVFILAWFCANPTYALIGVVILVALCGVCVFLGQTVGKKGKEADVDSASVSSLESGDESKGDSME